jgi:hypothetical protein
MIKFLDEGYHLMIVSFTLIYIVKKEQSSKTLLFVGEIALCNVQYFCFCQVYKSPDHMSMVKEYILIRKLVTMSYY